MTNEKIELITYRELLQKLNDSNENHLLLGNGFNLSLGVSTNYESIFNKMIVEYSGYNDINIAKINYDIEALISKLKEEVVEGSNKEFLHTFIENKIKYDFMKSAYGIVKENIKEVYQEKTQGVHLLLKNFSNYFTLNYDPLLYLLLMKFKKNNEDISSIAFSNTELFIQDDLNKQQNSIYTKIKDAYEDGTVKISSKDKEVTLDLNSLTKSNFVSEIKKLFQEEKWNRENIKIVCNKIWEEKDNTPNDLNANDGFSYNKIWKEQDNTPNNLNVNYDLYEDLKPENIATQNLFFLHGAFHIYKQRKIVKKLTQEKDKTLYEKLENIINKNDDSIICILKGSSQEKENKIMDNDYLKNGFNKLNSLNGVLVLFGSSLDDNDNHIFTKVNNSNITTIYVSSSKKLQKKTFNRAIKQFPSKKIILFDYETVSYDNYNDNYNYNYNDNDKQEQKNG
ncbi:MAG: DUF4917 family protein [Alphaproteobacteria bacterium]|nr:DUF4917 family protein [Alphaproteobacteria bacterium]